METGKNNENKKVLTMNDLFYILIYLINNPVVHLRCSGLPKDTSTWFGGNGPLLAFCQFYVLKLVCFYPATILIIDSTLK